MADPQLPPELEAVGFLAWPIVGLADLVAEAEEFHARTGAANQTDAYKFIHYPGLQSIQELNELPRPAAVISLGKKLGFARVDGQHLRPEPDLVLTITDWCHFPAREDYGLIDFLNFVGPLLYRLGLLQGDDGRLAIASMEWRTEPMRTDPAMDATQQPYWLCEVGVNVSNI